MRNYYRERIKYYDCLGRNLTPEEKSDYDNAKKQFDKANNDVDCYCERFGPCFKKRNGWATCAIRNKSPSFADIEATAGFGGSRILYIAANFPIHSGPRAAFYRRGLPSSDFILMGQSVYGFKEVINYTAQSLENLTRVLMYQCSNDLIENIYEFLFALTDRIVKASEDAEKLLGSFDPNRLVHFKD